MSSNNLVSIEVSFYAESEKSYRLYVRKNNGVWSRLEWFPKSVCSYNINTKQLTMPKWLYNKTFR